MIDQNPADRPKALVDRRASVDSTDPARAVLCDMDGTLIDSNALVERVWAGFATRFDLRLEDVLHNVHGLKTIVPVRKHAPPGVDLQAVADELDAQGLVRTDGIVEVSGTGRLLASLRHSDAIAPVTSANRELALVRMSVVGLPMPAVAVCAEDASRGKPHPEG